MEPRELLRRLGLAGAFTPEAPGGWEIKCPIHSEVTAVVTNLATASCSEGCTYETYVNHVHGLIDEKITSLAAQLPAVPIEVFPEKIAACFLRAHENTGAPLAYFALGALPVVATALGAKVKLYVMPGWLERACFHVALIGASGQGKDPALNMLIKPLIVAELKLNEGNRRSMEQWEAADKKTRGPAPVQNELLQKDATTEAMGQSLAANPQGVLMYDGELVGLVQSIGQYKHTKGNDRQTFLNYWPGTMAKFKRVGKLALVIPEPTVNIVGGLQDKLLSALGGDDGLRARFLFAVGERRRSERFFKVITPESGIRMVSSEVEYAAWTDLINRLNGSRNKGEDFVCVMTPEAQELAEPFLWRLENELGIGDSEVAEMYRKMKGHVFRVALVLHALDCADTGEQLGEIDVEVMRRTLRLLDWCTQAALLVLNNDDGSTPADRERLHRYQKLEAFIGRRQARGEEVTRRVLRHYGPSWVRTCRRQDLEEALDALGYAGNAALTKRLRS